MEKNKITIITVCFNASTVIEPTIRSVIAQTYNNIEYIIIDGGSTDDTLEIIKKYQNNITRWVSENDNGIYDGMNKGINMSTGDWIIFMNAGDRFLNKNVLRSVFVSETYNDDIGIIYGDSYKTNGIYAKFEKVMVPFWQNKSYLHGNGICHQASFVSTKIAHRYPFDLRYKHAADMKMFQDIYNSGYKFKYVDIPICLFDVTDSFGKRNPWSGVKDQAKILNRFGTFMYYMCCLKELVFVKPKSRCASYIKLFIRLISKNAYQCFLKRRGWQLLNKVTDSDWGIVNHNK